METEKSWAKFEMTGSVMDYLEYVSSVNRDGFAESEKKDEDHGQFTKRGNYSTGNDTSQRFTG